MAGARDARCRAFTLVELLIVIAIIGTLMGLLLPAVQNAREAARSNGCRANLTQLQHAMTSYEVANKEYPGYVNVVGTTTKVTKASWGAMMLPFIEQSQLWDEYARGRQVSAPLELYVCPSNPPETDGTPAMSYLANAGFIQDEHLEQSGELCCKSVERIANGVFVDKVRQFTPDVRDLDDDCIHELKDVILEPTFELIQGQGDGATNTLMFAEGLNALYWTHVGGDAPDKKWHFGFCWEQPGQIAADEASSRPKRDLDSDPQFRAINRVREVRGYASLGLKTENSGFPSSHHPGGVNVAFCGGSVRLLSERIHPTVYAQLMTSIRKRSDLVVEGVFERDMAMPDAGAF